MSRFEFTMPDVGEGLAEVEVAKWKVAVGDSVVENQPIADIETDKSVVSMPAPATGTIVELAAGEGDRVAVGALLLVIERDDAGVAAVVPATASPGPAEPTTSSSTSTAATSAATPAAAPAARKLARELDVALEHVSGTGPRGRITPEDVRAHAEAAGSGTAIPEADDPNVEEVPLRGIRRRVAENLTRSYREIPHVAGFHEFVVPRLVREYERLKPQAEAEGTSLTYLAFVVRATALALGRHSWLNAEFDEERSVVRLKRDVGLGIAMASPDGLVVPVIHGANRLGLLPIAAELERIGSSAAAGTLTPEDLRGGSFTVSNVGPAGGNYGTSLIRPSEVAILGLGRIQERAVVEAGEVVARPVLPVSLTFDHRVVDGAQALAFVTELRGFLEQDPGSLRLDERGEK